MEISKYSDLGNILNEDLTNIETTPARVAHLFKELTTLCKVKSGLGVAANQVGLRENFFFAAAGAKFEGKTTAHICIQPSWRPHPAAALVDVFGEGCLSLPGELYQTKRWSSILATWTNTQGHVRKDVRLSNIAAHVFQHEHDHLRGVTLRECGRKLLTPLEEAFKK